MYKHGLVFYLISESKIEEKSESLIPQTKLPIDPNTLETVYLIFIAVIKPVN